MPFAARARMAFLMTFAVYPVVVVYGAIVASLTPGWEFWQRSLILVPFMPNLPLAIAFLLARSALSQMDVPTRTSYVMAVVTPAERTAAASVTAVPRSLASAISPAISGALLSTAFAGLPLVICGVLKIVYDLSLLFSFRHIKPPEEKEAPR